MSTEEPQLENGAKPEPEHNPESNPVREPAPISEPEPNLASQPPSDSTPVAITDADPKAEEPKDASIQSNEADISQSNDQNARPELRKDDGSRTFTMRELLSELKTEEGDDASTPRSQQSTLHPQADQNSAAMELINSVTGADEEGRSRQKILTFAAKRYASAIERNPEDYDALYNWALVLQESADNVNPDSTSPSKDALLEEACKKYDEATRLCPTLHDAFYNWAIAISDRAKMRGRTKEAEELWKQATKNYEKAVQLNWNSPQALNNWGLALQELSAIVPAREKQKIVRTAISKFRAAIQLQFDFHRAIYNLGTVLYGLAEDTLRTGGATNPKDVSPNELYSQSAIYIAAAHALKPNYSVYSSALRLVRSMVNQLEQKQTQNLSGRPHITNSENRAIKVDIPDIVSVSACADLTLPPGAGLCIDTIHGPFYFVADSWESLEGWLDAIRLVYTIYARGKSEVLASIVTG
ncbi:hypothetical protein MANES_01G051700v8 [Manihot esculenta]|uniref:Uncharacterized protein n=1 Tax=Manihot esculenta TaxID=3983 RepID=A0ACB7IAU9_MANES|nr:hypothetical protein MANES_01G051700v8 [Manihot esculenta]